MRVTSICETAAETCRIAVDYGPGELAIEVVDDGRGGDPATGGFGLTGLRERVEGLLAYPHEQLTGGAQLFDGDRDLADR